MCEREIVRERERERVKERYRERERERDEERVRPKGRGGEWYLNKRKNISITIGFCLVS